MAASYLKISQRNKNQPFLYRWEVNMTCLLWAITWWAFPQHLLLYILHRTFYPYSDETSCLSVICTNSWNCRTPVVPGDYLSDGTYSSRRLLALPTTIEKHGMNERRNKLKPKAWLHPKRAALSVSMSSILHSQYHAPWLTPCGRDRRTDIIIGLKNHNMEKYVWA